MDQSLHFFDAVGSANDEWMASATMLAAIATAIAAFFTARSVSVSKRMAAVAEKQLSLETTPYIAIETNSLIKAKPTEQPSLDGKIILTIKNVGKVTAKMQSSFLSDGKPSTTKPPILIEPTQRLNFEQRLEETKGTKTYGLKIEFWPEGIPEKSKIKIYEVEIDWEKQKPSHSIVRDEYIYLPRSKIMRFVRSFFAEEL